MQEVKKKIDSFLTAHRYSITDLEIQCDKDSICFLKIASIKQLHKGAAYRISDYVAWCNNRKRTPNSVIEIDFTNKIPERIKKILKLN